MQTLAFLSQKGGSGKTTLAVHIAVAAQENGERVVIVDTDLQKSATTWSDARRADTPAVAPVAAAALPDVIQASRHDAMTMHYRHRPPRGAGRRPGRRACRPRGDSVPPDRLRPGRGR